ncbi:MAG: hypothetical protein HN348_07405 [Proteobacteria bacterium]|jgi:hypothetical protein|nr:hypothetical protein [Pseudomonadota bacterium]
MFRGLSALFRPFLLVSLAGCGLGDCNQLPILPMPDVDSASIDSPDGSWVRSHMEVEVDGVVYVAFENEYTCGLIKTEQHLDELTISGIDFSGELYSSTDDTWGGELKYTGVAWRMDVTWCDVDCQGADEVLGGLGYAVVNGDELMVTRYGQATVDTNGVDCDLFLPFPSSNVVEVSDATLRIYYERS